MSSFYRFFLLFGLGFMLITTAQAQNNDPAVPEPIQNLVNEGAQIRYMGRDHGFDAWLTVKNGQEQYFYVLPDQSAFVMGVLFDNTGKLITVEQVQRLRGEDPETLDALTSSQADQASEFDLKSPAEQLYSDVENTNWVPIGQRGAPFIYSFIDPQCPHCHAFINELIEQGHLANGQIQVRMIPVGFREDTIAQSAFLIATPNPQERWLEHLQGDEKALPINQDLNTQGVQRNLAVMQAWNFDATPMIVYRAKDGEIKIIRGKAKDMGALLRDISP